MRLTRTTIIGGVAALSFALSASPALAKGGNDGVGDTAANNSVVTFIAPGLVLPTADQLKGSNRPSRPRA